MEKEKNKIQFDFLDDVEQSLKNFNEELDNDPINKESFSLLLKSLAKK